MSNKVTTLITTDKAVANNAKRLSICLRSNGFSFSIVTLDQVLLTFGQADFDFNLQLGELSQAIKDFFVENDINTFEMRQMSLIVPSDNFAWIPEHLYDAAYDRQYLKMVGNPDMNLGTYHCYVPLLGSYMAFSAQTTIIAAFKIALPGIDVHSQHTILVNETLMKRSMQHPLMVMHVRSEMTDIEAFYANQLLLSNSFVSRTRDEMLYHTIDVMKQLHLETPDMELAICGDVDRELYGFLQHYFPNVTLYTGRPTSFINSEFNTFPTYKHALLLS